MTASAQADSIRHLAARIGRPVKLMEVCGTHTMSAFRSGLRSVLPPSVSMLSGPGCPVCVTPTGYVDQAVALAGRPKTLVATFGDMVRVPGTELSLERARAAGGRVLVVYSPLDALEAARRQPAVEVVFLGVGFETTVPATAWAVREAARNVPNFRVLCAHKTMPRAMAALLEGGAVHVDAFLCPGHVSVVIGSEAYEPLCRKHKIPCVVAGFEAPDMLAAIEMALTQVADGRAAVEVQYSRSVDAAGNAKARAALDEVFEPCDAEWRGLGVIPGSGLRLREAYRHRDAAEFLEGLPLPVPREPAACRCGDVLRGSATPAECPLFRTRCTPDNPVGACMVSSEGTCAAWFKYSR